jgi:tetratricopeptide (TPR) repeat protein
MRFFPFALLLIAASFAAPGPDAFAQAGADEGQPVESRSAEKPDPATLDELFDRLRRETNAAAARRIARQVIEKLNDSGSATVNMLMGRAAVAMSGERNALAEDMLTHVIVLAPDFAEGWNRRATLHYTQGKLGEAISDIEKVLDIEPRHFGALSGLATILQRTGQDRQALAVWYRLLAVYPAMRDAQEAVSDLEDKLAGQRA